VSSVSSALT